MINKTIFIVIVSAALGNSELSFIEPCQISDSTCLKNSVQKAVPFFVAGLPELDVEELDPLHIEDIRFELAGLKFSLSDGRVKGFKNSVVDSVSIDPEKGVLELNFHLDATLKGHYTAAGQLLVLPITGDGEMKLKLKDLYVKMTIHGEKITGDDGKEKIVFNGHTFSFDVKGNAHYTLTNLFNGNKELSEALLNFLNENWQQITHEFGSPVMKPAVKKIYENIKNFFTNMPLEELTAH